MLDKEISKESKRESASSTKPKNERLISKTARPTDARKKALATTFQVYHLFPQSLNMCINGVNSKLNSPHEKGSGNLTEMV